MELFTKGELEVMRVLWEHGELTPPQIEERFPRPIGNAALRSVLLVLMEKGHVVRTRMGKAYVYSARTPLEKELRGTIRRISDIFFGGSTKSLIARLLEDEKLTEDEIRELRDVAGRRIRKADEAKGGRR